LSQDAKGAVDGYYDRETGNIALHNTIQNEIENRTNADEQLGLGILASKTEVECNDGTISVNSTTGSNGQTIYHLSGVQQVPNVSVTSEDNSIRVTETTVGNNRNFDLSLNSSDAEWIEVSSIIPNVYAHMGIPVNLTKDDGTMPLEDGAVKSLIGLYHSSIRIDYTQTYPSPYYVDLTIEILKGSTLFKSFDCVVDSAKKDAVQTFVIDFDFEMNNDDYKVQYRTGGLAGSFTFKNYIHKVDGGIGSSLNNKVSVNGYDRAGYLNEKLVAASGSSISFSLNSQGQYVADVNNSFFDNPILMTIFLMNENGNLGFTGSHWAGDGSWNSYGINITTRYYKVSSLGKGEISDVKFWNYNGSGKIRICVMNSDGSIKCQSNWQEITSKGESRLPMYAESGQDLIIERNTDYWIGICCYGLQLASYNKSSTCFDDSSLRYAVCIKNGGQFPETGTGWDNPNTDEVNSIPTEIPCIYLVTSESN